MGRPHFHQLLKLFAESQVAAMGRAQGREAGEGILGKGDREICKCGSGQEPGSLPDGQSVPAWARCTGGSAAAAADSGTGGEEEEREASLCSCEHGERPQQSGQGFHALLNCEANINAFTKGGGL